jgi:ABC-2 type transport system permease protein
VSAVRRLGVITGHELRIMRRDPISFMVLIAFPIIIIAFLKPAFRPALVQSGYVHANGAEQVVPGEAAMAAFYLVALVTFAFYSERGWATWDRVRASRAASSEIVLGKALPRAVMGFVQLVVLFCIAFCACLVLLGVCVTALCRTAQQANGFAYLGMVLFGAIGGAFVPFNLLPAWARAIAPVTPTYWAMRGMRSVVLQGRGISGVALPAVVLLGMGLLFGVVALQRLRFDEAKLGWV